MTSTSNNEKNHYSSKPPIIGGVKFDYWKDKIKIFFLGYNTDLWDIVMDGYTHFVDSNGLKLETNQMDEQ